ncbi:hypothetical protein GCM10009618_11660 [Nesterenkonia lacusekhoensis]
MVYEGAVDLAAFDYALRKEIDYEDTYVSYDAHSFGAAVVGTASAEDAVGSTVSDDSHTHGVKADSLAIAGPVGFGMGVQEKSDLANPDVDIYWVETRDDIAMRARGLMPYTNHLENSFEEHMLDDLGATRLESGTMPDPDSPSGRRMLEDGDYLGGGHSNYYVQNSDALNALRAVALGEGAVAGGYVDQELMDEHIETAFEGFSFLSLLLRSKCPMVKCFPRRTQPRRNRR